MKGKHEILKLAMMHLGIHHNAIFGHGNALLKNVFNLKLESFEQGNLLTFLKDGKDGKLNMTNHIKKTKKKGKVHFKACCVLLVQQLRNRPLQLKVEAF